VTLGAEDVFRRPRRQVARRLALLPQTVEDIFPATVMETALIGRHPHIGGLRWESRDDVMIAARALAETGLSALADRDVLTLSGGERRRLAIAQLLTQAPGIFLLDEPTNHLDPQHQIDAMRTFRAAADSGASVIAALHDVNLAVRFADRCLLLFGDGRWQLGAVADVLSESSLEALYAATMEPVIWRGRRLYIAGGADLRSGNEAGERRQQLRME
jgi:iron complex transport system ATP-binding protein